MNKIKISVLACFLFVNNNMQAEEPCWYNTPPICRNPNFVYAAGVGEGNAEKIRNLAEANALRRYAAEVEGVQIPEAKFKEVEEKGLENVKVEALPVQYRVVRQRLENKNFYILLLLPKRFSTTPREITYPEEELCDLRQSTNFGNSIPTKTGVNIKTKVITDNPTDLEFVITEDGAFTLTIKTKAEKVYFGLFDKNGNLLMPSKSGTTAGKSYKGSYGAKVGAFPNNNVIRCEWSPTNIFEGNFTYILDAGNYNLRLIRSGQGISEVDLTTQTRAMR